jgi:hypothetical protein
MTEVTKPAGHPARRVNHFDRSQRRLDGRHFLRPDSAPKVMRAQVYAGRSGDYCVSVWFPSNAEAEAFAKWADDRLRKPGAEAWRPEATPR